MGLSQPNILSKAIGTWLDLGVLAAVGEGVYRVLEVSAAGNGAEAKDHAHRPSEWTNIAICNKLITVTATTVEVEMPPVVSVQQQQAEQMRVYWKVRASLKPPLGFN